MARDNGQGIFLMDFINTISRMKVIELAKTEAHRIIGESSANDTNKSKACAMVAKSRSVRELIFGMTNFSMSHQGMPVIR